GLASVIEPLIEDRISPVAVWCSIATLRSLVHLRSSLESRAFSIASRAISSLVRCALAVRRAGALRRWSFAVLSCPIFGQLVRFFALLFPSVRRNSVLCCAPILHRLVCY